MDFLRRHLPAVLGFPLVTIALVSLPPVLIAAMGIPIPGSTTWVFARTSVFPLAGFTVALVAVHLVLYRRSSGQRRAEWSVLAPVLVGALFLGGKLQHVVHLPVRYIWPDLSRGGRLVVLPLNALVLVCVGALAAMLTGWLVTRRPSEPRRATLWHDLGALVTLVIMVNVFRYAGARAAHVLFPPQVSPEGLLAALPLARAVEDGILLSGLTLAMLVLALLVYRGADRPSRATAVSLTGGWVGLDGVLAMSTFAWGMLGAFPPVVRQWMGVILYVTVSALAILYARFVVRRLWAAR